MCRRIREEFEQWRIAKVCRQQRGIGWLVRQFFFPMVKNSRMWLCFLLEKTCKLFPYLNGEDMLFSHRVLEKTVRFILRKHENLFSNVSATMQNNPIPCRVWELAWIWANQWSKTQTQHPWKTTINLPREHDQETWKLKRGAKTFSCTTIFALDTLLWFSYHI